MIEYFLVIAMIITLVILTYPITKYGYVQDKPFKVNKIVYESYYGGPIE